MHVYFDQAEQVRLQSKPRNHPWTVTENTAGGRYVDFKLHPELIRETLEDLKPFERSAAADAVVELITWANGTGSMVETNDFALGLIRPNTSPQSAATLQLHGRITFLFRDLTLNLSPEIFGPFLARVEQELARVDPVFVDACWAWSPWRHNFVELAAPGARAWGACFIFRVWAWGNSPTEVEENLARAFRNLHAALESASATAVVPN